MKNIFDILKGKEELFYILNLNIEEYEKTKKDWEVSKEMIAEKYTKPISEEIKKLLNSYLNKLEEKKEMVVRLDNRDRKNGKSFQERKKNIDEINNMSEWGKEYRADLNKRIRPIQEWILPADWFDIKANGISWFVSIFYKRILK